MKRTTLLRYLRRYGCYLKREGASHSLWCNPISGATETVQKQTEIKNQLAQKICRNLGGWWANGR